MNESELKVGWRSPFGETVRRRSLRRELLERRVSEPERSDFWLEGEQKVPTHGRLPGTKRKEKTR